MLSTSEMSALDGINGDIYRQMIELQEKLKQSEAERTRLEEMFKILLKTYKEEEDMRQKYLESRYRSFLDDYSRRNYRNEKILRSVERVENAANVLYAKTERLKLLRNHYEAYLGRVIPTWRQNFSLQYGPHQLPSMQKLEWPKQSQLIPEEIPEQCGTHITLPSTVKSRTPYSDQTVPADYFLRKPAERERLNSQLSSNTNYFNRDYKNQTGRNPETWEKLIYARERDRNSEENFDLQISNYSKNKPIKPVLNVEEANYDPTSMVKGLDTQLHRKLVLDNPWESVKKLVPQERTNELVEDDPRRDFNYVKNTDPALSESYLHKFSKSKWVPPGEKFQSRNGEFSANGKEREYLSDRPAITREPVEIKKPEFLVGKLHPEARQIFEASELEMSPSQNAKQENFKPRPIIPASEGPKESESINIKITDSTPHNKWNLLKHKNSINKLKETLFIEEGYDHQEIEDKKLLDNVIRSVDKLYDNSEKEFKNPNVNDPPEVLPDDWQNGIRQETPLGVDADSDININLTKGNEDICSGVETTKNQFENQYQEEEGEYSQKEAATIPHETNEEGEGYDDNEETYPESYFEQPPKPDYSRDIVSNVILEEDESEAYANDGAPEDAQKVESEQMNFDSEVLNNNPEYNINRAEEVEGSDSQYQNLGPDNAAYSGVDEYANSTNYNDIPQQQYMYENQEYNENNDYNNMEQYQSSHPEQQEYYGQSQDLENYAGEAIEQPYEHENVYNQEQGFENNPALEQYGQNYQEQYNEGEMMSDGNYYNQGEYDGGYYESQVQQNNDYPENKEQENPDMMQGEQVEANQGEGDQYGDETKNSNVRQSYFAQLLESDTESFQMEHGSAMTNEDSDFDFSLSQKQ